MLSFSQVKSAGSAGNYYTEKDNYYVIGSMEERWQGKGAELLGLEGKVDKQVFTENEDELQRAIEALTHDKTIIMIAHRLKTVRNADQILVLDNAHIVQRGTHAELIQQKGLYADFVSARQEAIGWKLAQ